MVINKQWSCVGWLQSVNPTQAVAACFKWDFDC